MRTIFCDQCGAKNPILNCYCNNCGEPIIVLCQCCEKLIDFRDSIGGLHECNQTKAWNRLQCNLTPEEVVEMILTPEEIMEVEEANENRFS